MRNRNRSMPGPDHLRSIAEPFAQVLSPVREGGPSLACRLLSGAGRRMTGPGGYYNAGNLLGLLASMTIPLVSGERDAGATLVELFVGDPGALAMSSATIIFLGSGELYHRAWSREDGPDALLNRLADLLSAIGALSLGLGLLMFGHVALAAAAGGLMAFGKFGSAFGGPRDRSFGGWPVRWPDPFRVMVIAGRFPAMMASGADCWRTSLFVLAGGSPTALVMPGAMLVCQLLWAKADLLLLQSDRTVEHDRPSNILHPARAGTRTLPI